MGLAFFVKSQELYDQSIQYKTIRDIPREYPDNQPAIRENDNQIVVFFSQSLTGRAAKIMDTVTCLPRDIDHFQEH